MTISTPCPSQPCAHLAGLQSNLASITQVLQILDPFFHRNKNQHRRSAWWADLSMLRRGLHKLLAGGEAHEKALVEEDRRAQAQQKRRRKTATATSDAGRHRKDGPTQRSKADLGRRARWLKSEAAPRAHLAFSQLAADNQYAALGVLLIGILAQVSVALGNLLEDLAGEEPHRGETAALSEPGAPQNAPGLELQADAALLEGNDLGVAVDRDWIRGMQEDTTSTAVTEPPTSAIDAMHDVGKQGKPQGRKRKKRGADEFDTLFSGLL